MNDQAGRRILLLDSTLKRVAVVADSSSGANGYGARPGGLIAYRGDSTLFVDPAALSGGGGGTNGWPGAGGVTLKRNGR